MPDVCQRATKMFGGPFPSQNPSRPTMNITIFTACALVVPFYCFAEDPPKPAPKERVIDFHIHEMEFVGGTVVAITKESIMISPEGKALVTIPFHDRLAAGGIQKHACAGCSYLVGDVKVGDLVSLSTIIENKQLHCVEISIWERLDGLVPPGQIVDKKQPFHERRNVENALRDKGTPIPEHLIPMAPTIPKSLLEKYK